MNWFKAFYFTCTCTDKKIRVHNEKDLQKFKYCPFCGLKIIKEIKGGRTES